MGFNVPKKIIDSILKKKWPKNNLYVEDDPYKALVFTYSKEMDQLVEVSTNTSEVEEKDFRACINGKLIKLDVEFSVVYRVKFQFQ
jgi:hypothetical protein